MAIPTYFTPYGSSLASVQYRTVADRFPTPTYIDTLSNLHTHCQSVTRVRRTMSGINRFLSRRDKNRSGSRQRKVKSPPPSPPICPLPPLFDGQSCSSCSCGLTASMPSRTHRSSSSSSLSLAFPALANGKGSARMQATSCIVHASTANSLDHYILQPQPTSGYLHNLFFADEKKPPQKDQDKKVGI